MSWSPRDRRYGSKEGRGCAFPLSFLPGRRAVGTMPCSRGADESALMPENRRLEPMKNVLLPLDGSARSLRTIDMVKQIYSPGQVAVTLVMVLSDQMHIDGQFERERIRRKAEQEMETFAALLEGWTVDTVLLRGNPGPEVVQFAKEKGYDTLIMTRSSRGPLQKLGSVATYIVRHAQFLDLVIMREAESEE